MKTHASVVAVVVFGFLAAISGCSDADASGDERENSFAGEYSFSDVENFLPEGGSISWLDTISMTAGEAWGIGWPDEQTTHFEPAVCQTYLTSVEMLLETDGSTSATDEIHVIFGEIGSAGLGDEVPISVYAKIRVFDSSSSASQFLNGLRSSASSCAGGYTYDSSGLLWATREIGVSDMDLSGIDNVLVADERDVSAESAEDLEEAGHYDHYTHYAFARGNIAFIASFGFSGSYVSDADAAELIGQFIEYIG